MESLVNSLLWNQIAPRKTHKIYQNLRSDKFVLLGELLALEVLPGVALKTPGSSHGVPAMPKSVLLEFGVLAIGVLPSTRFG